MAPINYLLVVVINVLWVGPGIWHGALLLVGISHSIHGMFTESLVAVSPLLFHAILQVYMSFHLMQIQLFTILNIFASIPLVATPLLYTLRVPEALNTE